MKLCLLFLIAFFPVSAANAAENWPMYGHDAQLSNRTGEFISRSIELVWEHQYPTASHVRAQPIIVDGVVYQTWMDGHLRAIDLKDGVEKWFAKIDGVLPGSACYTAGRIVVGVYKGSSGELRAYDKEGKLLWMVASEEPFFASPIAYRGRIFIGDLGGTLWAIDAENGAIVWRAEIGSSIRGPAACKDGIIAVQASDMKGYAYNFDGSLRWTTDLPGERLGHTHPVIGADKVVFSTSPRGRDVYGTEGTPYWGWESCLDGNWNGEGPKFESPDALLRTNLNYYQNKIEARSLKVARLSDGVEAFIIPLPVMYWGTMQPVMATDSLLAQQAYVRHWRTDLTDGKTTTVGDIGLLFRPDEYAYGIMGGGQRFYGAIVDDLGEANFSEKNKYTLFGDFYSHETDKWTHPPDDVNKMMFVPGPGDGNSGYNGSPIPYDGYIVWQYSGSWLRCDRIKENIVGHERPDTEEPAAPTGLVATTIDSYRIALSWKPATDNISVRGYRIYRNGVLIAETDDTKYEDIDLAANTRFRFEVSAYDAHNNESPKVSSMEAATLRSAMIRSSENQDSVAANSNVNANSGNRGCQIGGNYGGGELFLVLGVLGLIPLHFLRKKPSF